MSWFRTHAGGENSEFDVNIDCVECAEYRTVGDDDTGYRKDVVLHLTSGKELTIDPVKWEAARGPITPLPEGAG